MTDHKYPGHNESQDRARHVGNETKHGQERKDQKHNQDQGRPQDRNPGQGAQGKDRK
ncbi:MAG: hypothetical protein Q8M03_16690 [Legionella sp.]|nr:hypothetical protein [Legionella sp.]